MNMQGEKVICGGGGVEGGVAKTENKIVSPLYTKNVNLNTTSCGTPEHVCV